MGATLSTSGRILVPLSAFVLILGVGTESMAADFAPRIESAKRSAEVGLGRSEVTLLERVQGPGLDETARNLLDSFASSNEVVTTRGRISVRVGDDRVSYVAEEGWFLDVYNDGSKASYRNYQYLADNPQLAVSVEERLSNEELDMLGREFIATQLGKFVRMGGGEKLVPSFTEFEITGGGSAIDSKAVERERVQSAVVVFSRSVDGVQVIGPGSKVAVVFANDRSPVGFDFDWPQYKSTAKVQRVLEMEELRARLEKDLTLDSSRGDVQVQRVDCGLVDLGARKRDPKSVIQAGCSVQSVQRSVSEGSKDAPNADSGYMTVAVMDYIPVGEYVEPHAYWPSTGGSNADDGTNGPVPKAGPMF